LDGREQPGEVGRVVREVRVHLHHVSRATVERMAKASQVGRADAVLLGAVQHLHRLALRRQLVGQTTGPVR